MGFVDAGELGAEIRGDKFMNILVFTSLYPNNMSPNLGVFIKERMTHVAQRDDCNVQVVAPVPYFPPIKISSRYTFSQVSHEEERDGLKVSHPRYFMTPKIGMSTYGWLMYKSVLQHVIKIQKDFDFDIIDAHYIYPDCYAAVLLGRYFNKPVIVSARGSDINQFAEIPAIRKKLRITMQQADHNIAVCTALKEAMVEIGAEASKVTVVPNGVDGDKFYPIDKKSAKQKIGMSGSKIILSVGQLIPRKGMDILINSFNNLIQQTDEDVKLVIAGDGASRNELEQLVTRLNLKDRVFLVGSHPHDELNVYYNAADLFCLASSREGWPNVVMESLATGTPVVATNIWGTPEILVSDDLGFLTERNAKDMTQKLLAGIRKDWDRNKIIELMKIHTWDRAAQSVRDVCSTVLRDEVKVENSLSS